MISRRYFLKSGAISMIGAGMFPAFLPRIASAGQRKGKKILITIFQRGAADGLNMVVPFAEQEYYDLRPTIAIPKPSRASSSSGGNETALDLDGFFGFHPSLRPFLDIYKSGHLAVVHATGSPDHTRSHFDAQDYMESGTPGRKSTRDGWLNRYLSSTDARHSTPFRAVSMTSAMPRTLKGRSSAVAMGSISGFDLKAGRYSSAMKGTFEALYSTSSAGELGNVGRETIEAVDFLKGRNPAQYRPRKGVTYPRNQLGNSLREVAQLIKADVGLEVAFAESGGWDHHANEGGVQGQLAQRVGELSQSLAALCRDLEDRFDDIVILTMSEFGRTVRENGNRGTDHGHANVMFTLGGSIRGGKVYGEWPGLEPDQLFEGRDLALTTDFRDVFAEVLVEHMGLENLSSVFPGYPIEKKNLLGFLA